MIETVERVRPQSAAGGRLKYWAPPIIWMSVIFWFSTDLFSGDNTGSLLWKVVSFVYPGATRELFDSIHFCVRKAGHLTEYAVLALLLFRAGLLAYVVYHFVADMLLDNIPMTADLSAAWYADVSTRCLLALVGLAGYGFWAACRPRLGIAPGTGTDA